MTDRPPSHRDERAGRWKRGLRFRWRTGAFQFKLGDQLLIAEAGTFVFVPRGINHTWRNAVLRRSRMVLTYVPGGTKAFFEEASPLMHADRPDRRRSAARRTAPQPCVI